MSAVNLLAAAKAVLAKAGDIDHIEVITVGAKAALDALAAAVLECDSTLAQNERDTEENYPLSRGDA